LERGYTPDSIVSDTQIKDEKDAPKNSDNSYLGRITLRKAVEKSKNVVAWRLFKELTPQVGLSYLKEMHFAKIVDSDYVLAAAVGGLTYGSNTMEMASGYATLANSGVYKEPTCIVSITDSEGEIIVSDEVEETQVYDENADLMMVDVMKGVLKSGTAAGLALNNNMPCAAKTGTTDGNKDGWFCGFTRYYTTTVWVGYDTPKTLTGLFGGTYPGRIWNTYMNEIHEGLTSLDWDMYETPKDAKKNSTEEYDNTTEEATTEETTQAPDDAEDDEDDDYDDEDDNYAEPVTEAPITEAPVTEAPVATEAPATEAPVAETPTVEGE
jgi:membrane peptidoglycan carboxypeptidase